MIAPQTSKFVTEYSQIFDKDKPFCFNASVALHIFVYLCKVCFFLIAIISLHIFLLPLKLKRKK